VRATQAALWVEKEVAKLLEEIEKIGRKKGQETEVTFGELFVHYQDVSDTLVGILQRAKKRGILKYEGEGGGLLLQKRHDNVVITMDNQKAQAWKKDYESGAAKAIAAQPPKPDPVMAATASKTATRTVAKPDATSAIKPSAMAAKPAIKPATKPAAQKSTAVTAPTKTSPDRIPMPVIYCLAASVVIIILFIFSAVVRFLFFRK
jgi:hypothetical protein